MKARFWGVRGSIASPGPKTVRYGGNTTCIEIETDAGDVIIIDAGTGIFPLAQSLLRRLPVKCSVFITHTHWDHIQGLPFFIPFFIPKNEISIYGAFDPVASQPIKDILNRQMEYCYFPVREGELKAEITYTNLRERETIEAGSARVTSILMNHPVLDFGYLVECDGKRLFFTGDNEPLYNIYSPDDDYYEEYETLIEMKNKLFIDFVRGVDVLIADSAYTSEEYPAKKGWGHGTFDSCIKLAEEAGVKSLYLTHHEPTRGDDALDVIYSGLQEKYAGPLEFRIASEGLEIEV
ncbi:MAG: MBL fold metallo-hydrolase [Nitrospirae bacterium]|nr:MAG: MBL fold metallo-hydrolase [Nitrospirota bacterium]